MIWEEASAAQINAMSRTTPIILPISATEQHGPHLPTGTDRIIGTYFVHKIHDMLGDEVIVLPTLPIGCSEHHTDFGGTLTLTHTTFIAMVVDVLQVVASYGFVNLILFNSHGGNIGSGQVIAEQVGRRLPDCRVATLTWWQAAGERLQSLNESGPGGVGHAGEFETSLMLQIAPHLVQRDKVEPGGNIPTFAWASADLMRSGRGYLYASYGQKTTNGVFGNPTFASAEKGAQISEIVVEELYAIIKSLIDTD